MSELQESVYLSARLKNAEVTVSLIQDDIKEIKRNIRFLLGLVFSLNTTIIGLLAKSMNII